MHAFLLAAVLAVPFSGSAECVSPWMPPAGSYLTFQMTTEQLDAKGAVAGYSESKWTDEVVGARGDEFRMLRTRMRDGRTSREIVSFDCLDNGLRPTNVARGKESITYGGTLCPKELAAGKTWTLSWASHHANGTWANCTTSYRVTRKESLVLFGRTFPVWRVDYVTNCDLGPPASRGSITGTEWRLANVGTVKSTDADTSRPGYRTTYELTGVKAP